MLSFAMFPALWRGFLPVIYTFGVHKKWICESVLYIKWVWPLQVFAVLLSAVVLAAIGICGSPHTPSRHVPPLNR